MRPIKTIIPEALIEELEERFKDKAPEKGISIENIMFDAGAVSVVRFLKAESQRQREAVLLSDQPLKMHKE